ncbi:twin transmembrane helix small protein [Steroidobacter sp. S1-65]|uniref:Twin transmembrane helix small protein n=1 Tax=Steroidobacter gossypii TaxID=2805490 RepID=A0ABS1WT52_9GAMM|nr:twin transmembrane helix small protein [Steroidobacter gossypii]MBM0104161.1 twin transmembrane helix small protein [Steroidobacter gossypii]
MVKIIILAGLIAVVLSLASGLFFLVYDKGESKKMVNALSVRVGLSVLLFLLLLLAWSQGMIKPHGM